MELPYPDHSGGSKYAWQKIRQLSKENEVFLVSFNETGEKIEDVEYKKYMKEYYFFPRKKSILRIGLQFFKPYSLTSRFNNEMYEKIKEIVQSNNIDIIVLDSIHMYYNIKNLNKNIPIFLTQQNIEYKLFQSISSKTDSLIKKNIYRIEAYKLKRLEKKLYKIKKIKGYIFISNEDLIDYENEIGKINAICIPPAITEQLTNSKKTIEEYSIVFTGKMNYEPNVTGVKWFVEKIFPNILEAIPKAKFYIVGKNPTEEIRKYSGEQIVVTGEVESVSEYLEKAQIVVIPLLSGGGVKLKLFDAMSAENIVITTQKGIEGTCLQDGYDLYVANEEKLFTKLCIDNLKAPNYQIAKHGKSTLQLNYGFDILQKKLQKFIEN